MVVTTTGTYYDIDGKLYPRVTHVLSTIDKPGLSQWRGRVGNVEANRVSASGAEIGTRFHEVVAEINRGQHRTRGWGPPEDLRIMANEYIDWLNQRVAKIVEVERLVVSERRVFAGTTDLVAVMRDDSQPSVLDVKTSNQVSEDWPLQLSAYRLGLAEEGLYTARRIIVRVPKKGTIQVEEYEYPDHEDDAEAFLNTLSLWNWMQRNKERMKAMKKKA